MLSVEEVANHFGLRSETVRRKIRADEINAIRLRRTYRLDWPDVWAVEEGPMPRGARMARYQDRLLAKNEIATALGVSIKTVERWIAGGMPTRKAFGVVRCNPHDVSDWLRQVMNADLPRGWWKP